MSTASHWTLKPDCLRSALDRWRATEPDEVMRELVHDWLMDLVLDPLHRGREERDHPGVWTGRIVGTDILVIYVPNVDEMTVCVSDIQPG